LTNPKKKGYQGEVEVVKILRHLGFDVKRAWGSDGRSINEMPDVDVSAKKEDLNWKVQVKRRKKLPKYMKFGNCNVLAVRQDRAEWMFCFSAKYLKELLNGEKNK
tara:strand:+ start:4988 stop:5302 length:315 start_codon:yes stop_codon:yes gene_type:complete